MSNYNKLIFNNLKLVTCNWQLELITLKVLYNRIEDIDNRIFAVLSRIPGGSVKKSMIQHFASSIV